MHSVRFTVKIN